MVTILSKFSYLLAQHHGKGWSGYEYLITLSGYGLALCSKVSWKHVTGCHSQQCLVTKRFLYISVNGLLGTTIRTKIGAVPPYLNVLGSFCTNFGDHPNLNNVNVLLSVQTDTIQMWKNLRRYLTWCTYCNPMLFKRYQPIILWIWHYSIMTPLGLFGWSSNWPLSIAGRPVMQSDLNWALGPQCDCFYFRCLGQYLLRLSRQIATSLV